MVSPVKAVSEVFTQKGANRVAKPITTLLGGAASLFKGFINLSAAAMADFANPSKFKQKPKLSVTEYARQTREAKEKKEKKFGSLYNFVLPQKEESGNNSDRPPSRYVSHIAKDGVTILDHQEFRCDHKFCEGDGTFIVTKGN
ncbi:MAG: hypothetical protein HC932_06530 [Thermales bacterium]|nr:hypothetical protein [Thermales bacterium]